MQCITPRAFRAFALTGFFAAGLLLCGILQTSAQQDPPKAGATPDEAKKKEKVDSIEVMTFPSDRDAKNMIRAVNDYISEYKSKTDKAPWDKICIAAQQVLDSKSDSFFEVNRTGETQSDKIQRVSAKSEANRLIGTFPPEGRQFYQLTYGTTAETMLAEARDKGYDRLLLADISQRYFHTRAGAKATLILATLNLDRGNYTEAAYSFERLLARPETEELWTPLTTFKAVLALKRSGNAPTLESVKLADQFERKFPRDGLKVAGRVYSLEELKAELARPVVSLLGNLGDQYIAVRYGNASHTAIAEGGAPFLDPAYIKPMIFRTEDPPFQEGSAWVDQNLKTVLASIKPNKQEVAIPGFFPLSTQNLLFIRNYDGVYAFITKDGFSNHGQPSKPGDLYWIAEAKGSLSKIMGEETKSDVEKRWQFYRDQGQLKTLLFDNPLVGSMTHDGQNVYLVDDAAIPPAPAVVNPNGGFNPAANVGTLGPDKLFTDGNRLVAIDIPTGNINWQLGVASGGQPLTDEEDDLTDNPLLLMQSCFFLGPPLPVNGKLYVLFEKNGKIRLACLDPSKVRTYQVPNGKPSDKAPELVWNQRLGEPNLKLPADAYRRFQCSFLTYSDGVMICPTNAGAVVAIDVMSRSLLWARSYRSIKQTEMLDDENRKQPVRRVPVNPNGMQASGQTQLSKDRWRAAAPMIANNRVVFASYDSETVDCLDLRTGDLIWSEPRRAGDLYVGGIIAEKVLIIGQESARAINLFGQRLDKPTRGGREEVITAWRDLRIGTPAGHGCASQDDMYYLPLADTPDANRPEVWAINVAKGEVVAKAAYRRKEDDSNKTMLGNLVFHEGQLFSQSPRELIAFPLIELKQKEMDRLLKANPNDPAGLLARGELNLDDGKLLAAITDFKLARDQSPPETIQERLREKMYQAYTELLRKDFAAGQSALQEYRELCSSPITETEPNAKQRQIDEQFRRKGLYLVLLAKGREKQGRLVEAFDAYREFANHGDAKQLSTIYDEPNTQIRPDVWSRGRIESMIAKAAADDIRKPLDERVAKEWQTAKADPKALKDFVRVFGEYFSQGREAQLLVAENALASGSEDELKSAEAQMRRLSTLANEPQIIARALEISGRILTRRGLLDDAVVAYTRLGNEFPNTIVRDGKTGNDFIQDLLTDKRLLPYLETTRLSIPNRIEVKRTAGNAASVTAGGFTLDVDAQDELPFYRRHRVTLANNESGNGTWILRIHDRATNQEYWKVPNLKLISTAGIPTHRVAQANGHLLLLHMGNTVHCVDVAERRTLWEYNILGDSNQINLNNVRYEPSADGEVFMTYSSDGTRVSLGRSSILEANYACMVTRDGLVTVEPTTGNKLWTRTNVSPSSIIFGDAEHVFVVEVPPDGKPRSRVFRAMDGSPVESTVDFADASGSNRLRILGRKVLLGESTTEAKIFRLLDPLTGKDDWKRTFPKSSTPVKTIAADTVAIISTTGALEVISVIDGKTIFKSQVDADLVAAHVVNLTKPMLLNDGERYYLILNRAPAVPNRAPNRNGWQMIRAETISGAIYCFDEKTAERLWYTDKLFDNQQLLIERFAEMPALVSGTMTQLEENNSQIAYRVIVVDKRTGRIRYFRNESQNNTFYGISTDLRTGTARLNRGDFSIEIGPDSGAATVAATPPVAKP